MSAVFPKAPEPLQLSGLSVEVAEVTIGQIPTLARLAHPIITPLTEMLGQLRAGQHIPWSSWLDLVGQHGDAALALVAAAVAQPVNVIAQLALDDFVLLAMTVLRVNLDFFARSLPVMTSTLGAMVTPGPVPSSDLSAPDTTVTAS